MLNIDSFLNGKVQVYQNDKGYKSGTDAVLLAAIISPKVNQKVLDMGCGVGVASLCLAYRVKNIHIYGIENNDDYYYLSLKNKEKNEFSSEFTPKLGDILNKDFFNLQFDIIMSNPPYYKKNINCINSSSIKKIGNMELSATLSDFINFAFYNLKNFGSLYLIQRSERLKETIDLLSSKHWGAIEIHPIFSFVNTPAKRFIVRAKKLAKNNNSMLHYGVVMHNNDNSYTKRAQDILQEGSFFYNNKENK